MYRTLPLGSSVHDLTPLVVAAGRTSAIGHSYLSATRAGQSGGRGKRSQPLRLSLRRAGVGGLSLGCCHFHFLLMNKLHKSMNKLHKTLSQGASSVIRGLAPRIQTLWNSPEIAEDLQTGVALRPGTPAFSLIEVGSADGTEAKTILPAQELSRQEEQNTLPHLVGNIQRPPEKVHLDRHEPLVGPQTGILAKLQPGQKVKIQQIIRYCKGRLSQTARTGALGPEGQEKPW